VVEHTGLTLEELEAQRIELLPDRIELRRPNRRKRRRVRQNLPPNDCAMGIDCYPVGDSPPLGS